jgi:glycine cleavage system aminomethyltransferase T
MANQNEGNAVSGTEPEKVFPHSIFVPYDPTVPLYQCSMRSFAIPWEYTGWRDETMSWKETCYIHGNLNPSPTYRVKGPEALKFLSDTCVNSFANFPIGTGKHSIMCTDEGLVMMDGVLLRLGEDDFITYWMAPYIGYALQKGTYNAVGENLTGKVFLFQIAGPRSLEVLEAATGDDLHDIGFMHHRLSGIDGMEVRVLRMGMAGTLAYELHGRMEDARPVYSAILEAGEPYGIRRLGMRAYMMNHTENGFPQAYYHFPYPWSEDKGFMEYLAEMKIGSFQVSGNFAGSMGQDIRLRYRNPVELGWAGMIKFDHDFVGRKALEKEAANPRRKMVTLVWNSEDIIDVYASQFRPGEPYQNMDSPNHHTFEHGPRTYYADQVLKGGKLIGISSGRAHSYYFREMISLSSINVEHSAMGTEVIVLWGNPGRRQKEIRAKVSRFPYLSENRNQVADVSKIPHAAGKK